MQSRLGLAYVRPAAYERSGQAHRNLARHARQYLGAAQLGLERAGSFAQQQSDRVDEFRLLDTQWRQGRGDGGLLTPGLRQVEGGSDSVVETCIRKLDIFLGEA